MFSPNDARARVPRKRRYLLASLAVAVLGTAVGLVALTQNGATAATAVSGGWTTGGSVSPASPARGQALTVTVTVSSSTSRSGLVDLEIYTAAGTKVYQQGWDNQAFAANVARTFSTSWTVPTSEALGAHNVKVGIFKPAWASLSHWNDAAATFSVTSAGSTTTVVPTTTTRPTTTTTTRPPTTTTTPPTTTAPPTTTPAGRFATLPPGSVLPSDATCAARVRPTAEVRPANAAANQTRGFGAPANPPAALYKRVTGNFVGTTDEIIQWAACKWGIDEDIVRAQTAKESWWYQSAVGDNGESFGLQQVRQPYWGWAFNGGNGDARTSSAYNLDAAMAARRNCFEGNETWLGGSYAKGDLWGCVGLWFSGRWYDAGANTYIAAVKDYLNQRVWETAGFKAG